MIDPSNNITTDVNVPRLDMVTIVLEDQPSGIKGIVLMIPNIAIAFATNTRLRKPDCK